MTRKSKAPETAEEILKDMWITQLGLARVSQNKIREIVGVDIYRVNRIVKNLKPPTEHSKKGISDPEN